MCKEKVWKDLDIKYQSEYHDLYVQNGTLLLADVFETSWKKCIEINKVDPTHFLLAPELVKQAVKNKQK